MSVTFADIQAAADLIAGKVVRTPQRYVQKLSEQTGAQLYLKHENYQYTGSFKERGAYNKLYSLTEAERKRGVTAMSAGNHAQGVARHAKALGIPATIVMPKFTPSVKVERTQELGAEVVLYGNGFDEAREHCLRLVAEKGLVMIHPYDDAKIIAGQGTVALEMLADQPDLDVLVIPIGGGGLISGNAIAAKALRPEIEVIGVQTDRFPSMKQALAGEPIVCGKTTLADGIAVKKPGTLTQAIIAEQVDDVLLVGEEDIEAAVLALLRVEKTMAEGAGAAGLAAVMRHRERFAGKKVGLVLCGGNIDQLVLSSIIQRGLVRSGRMVRLLVTVRDQPGALAQATQLIAETEASVVEVHHQRTFTTLPLEVVEIEFVLLVKGKWHLERILATLQAHELEARLLDIPSERFSL